MKRLVFRTSWLSVLLLVLAGSAFAIFGAPTAITYIDQATNTRIICVFSLGGQAVAMDRWDGSQWQWSDLGSLPPGLSIRPEVPFSAITYSTGAGPQIIDVFAVASNSQGWYHLVRDHWDGSQWSWSDQGVPPNLPYPSLSFDDGTTTSAITYVDSQGLRRIYVFAVGINGHLVVNYWIGFHGATWQWSDRGLPPGVSDLFHLSAITFADASGTQWVYVFGDTDTGKLVVQYWGSGLAYWANQGAQTPGVSVQFPSAITYVGGGGVRKIYILCTSANGDLVVNWWNGFAWSWANRGRPPGESWLWQTSAITYTDLAGQQIYVFTLGRDTGLNVNYWDGNNWHWSHAGTPAGISPLSLNFPNSLTYTNSFGGRVMECFVWADNNLQMAWNGLSWIWADLGTGP